MLLIVIIPYVASNREIQVNLEMLSICDWNNKGILRKSDKESVLRQERE